LAPFSRFLSPYMSVSPAATSPGSTPVSFEIKSAQLPLVALLVKTGDWAQLSADLLAQYGDLGENPDFFDHDPLVLDFSQLDPELPVSNLVPLLKVLRACRLVAVAMRGASQDWMTAGRAVGLVEALVDIPRPRPKSAPPVLTEVVTTEVVREVVREIPAVATMVIDKPLRSGQKVYARGADLVVLAMVNQGAEVVADGNIHVWAPLRGKAMAGASGNTQARIFSLCLEPELISIAGIYRTSENPLSPDVRGKPAQVRLSNDGQDKLLFEALNP
jgi:septum site-determining protein MinC